MIITLSEIIYIIRPVVYGLSLKYYGLKSWKPFFISGFLDFLRTLL